MSRSLHLSHKIQLTIIPNIEFCSGNVWIQKSLLLCPYLWILDRVISAKVTHPNIAIVSSNIWSFRRSISWWPLPKTSRSSEVACWDQITSVYLNWNTFFYLVRDIIQCKITSIWEFLKESVSILFLNFTTKVDHFRIMFLTLLLCKMAFSCINSHEIPESYTVTLSYPVEETALEFDGCSFFGLITKNDKVLEHFYLYTNTPILRNFHNMPRS